MTDCNHSVMMFPRSCGRTVEADFSGGDISSDGGVLLLRQAEKRLGLLSAVSKVLSDPRDQRRVEHNTLPMLTQRIYGLCLGYEDLLDHRELRKDVAIQTAIGCNKALASVSTMHRFEQWSDNKTAWAIHGILLDQFIASYKKAPKKIILDFDATDDTVHGNQEKRFFHGYYDHYCFLPLYVFCGDQLLCAWLRPSNIDGAKHAWAILSLLVKRIRHAWPEVRIIFRGDSGFCRHRMLDWCDSHDVKYIIGIAKNARLNVLASTWMQRAEEQFNKTGEKQRLFGEFLYAAGTWKKERRVIAKAEYTSKGSNPRYIVTNLEGDARHLYDHIYCARGEMENRIKEQQLDLFADRTSCHKWWPNQFRLLLASLAYTLIEAIRRLALHGTELARARCSTIRLKLFKVGAIILKNTRRIRFLLASGCPYQEIFRTACRRLA